MSQQLVKKDSDGRYSNVMPKSWIEAIKDKSTGQSLVEILQGFNMYFLSYNGNTSSTRCSVPMVLRKKGLWITYVKYDGNVYTEWYAGSNIDDKSWGDSSNWRIGNNTLVGDITISSNGNWVINGAETKFKAVGEKGNTPLIRVANNRLQVSYDLGDTYRNVTENPVYTQFRNYNNKIQVSTNLGATWVDASDEIAAYFRWQVTTGDTQANNVGRLQISRDNKTWTNLSNDIINNLHISKYIGANESLPTSGIAEGTIYAKGPTYAVEDTSNSNPIYRLWVYAWKDNTLAWQDNGKFTSISAGIVQEIGYNENAVMSQKVTTEKLTELERGVIYDVPAHNGGAAFESLSALLSSSDLDTLIPTSVRHGGMTIRFIQGSEQSSDNKYVQYLYHGTSTAVADFTNTTNWEKTNLEKEVGQLGYYINKFNDLAKYKGWIGTSAYSYVESATHVVVPCNAGDNVHIKANNLYACLLYVVKSYTAPVANGEAPDFVSGEGARRVVQSSSTLDFTAPSETQYIVVGYQLNDAIYTPAEFTINGYNVLESIREAITKNTSEIANNAKSLKETTFGVYGGKLTLNITKTYSAAPLGEIAPKGCVLTDIGSYSGDLWLVDTQSNNHRVRGVPFVLTTDISGVFVSTAGTISLTFSAITDVFNTVSEYKSEDFVFGYYNTGSVSIGDYLPEFRTYENISALTISVKAGDIITSKFQNNDSNQYCKGWILTDKDKKILSWSADGNLDYLTNLLEQNITNDGYLIIQHQPVASLSSVLISQYRRVINLYETIKDESKKTVQDYIEEQGISKDFVQICLPDKIYATAGDKLQLFYRGFIKAVNPYNYDIKITCSVGQQFPRYYQYAPAASASNRIDDLLVQIKNNAGYILAEKTIQIITCSTPVSPDSQRHVLIFGDSLTAKGQWAAETYRRLIGNGGNPTGKQLTNISFDGAMVKDGAGYFGIGGWTWNDYETNVSGFRFQVSGVTALNNGDSYTCNGNTFTLIENNTTDGVGEIMMIRIAGSASPDISGSLQRVSGVGDETINYSSWSEDVGNPLWDSANNKMSFIPYANLYSDGSIDVVYVLLGGNSVQAWQTNFNTMKTAIKNFVDTLHAEFPNAKCKIIGLEIPSVRGGAGGNIATGVRLSDQYGMTNGVMNMNMFYQDLANSSETSGTSGDAYNTFVEYVDIASQFDTEYNMPHEMADVNSRNSVDKEWRDTNQLHPADCGYMQIADVIYRNFVANYCQS